MTMPQIVVKIDRDGKVMIEGVGYAGDKCISDLRKLISVLSRYGIDVSIVKQELKDEYYVRTEESVKVRT